MGQLKRQKPVRVLSILLCFTLLLSQPAKAGTTGADSPREFSPSLSFGEESPEKQATEYILALDNSGSMRKFINARNAAAAALIQSLPSENTSATAFFFSDTCETQLELLPMSQGEARQTLTAAVEGNAGAGGGTDLGLMMRTAINQFSGQGTDPSVRHVLFVVTDGQSDGQNGLASSRDEEFFSLCRTYQDTVCTYVVYVSDSMPPDSLCEGLHTEPITLEDNEPDTLAACIERLVTQDKAEAAKVLSISNSDLMETALLLLCFSTEDDVSCRVVEQDSVIDFEIPPLCTQTLTIALSGGVSVRDALNNLKREGEETDLLADAEIGAAPSIAVIRSRHGLPPGHYTMEVKTDTPLSIVLSYQCNFQIRYELAGVDQALAPPADTQAVLQMQLLDPDGTPLEPADSPELSMNIYRNLDNGELELCASVKSGDPFFTAGLEEGEHLRLYPVIGYSGKTVELDQFWNVQLSKAMPEATPGPDASPHPEDPEPPEKASVPIAGIGLLILAVTVVPYVLYRVWKKIQQDKKELERQRNESLERQLAIDKADQEISLTSDLIRASVRWQTTTFESGTSISLGGLGLTDDGGTPRSSCNLGDVEMWCLNDSGNLTLRKNPLEFCLWRYSPDRKCTELVLLQTDEARITHTGDLLRHEYPAPSRGTYLFFGVDQRHQSGTVTIKTGQLEATFQLEYCMDEEPFIYERGSNDV